MVVLGWRLDLTILEVFSNLSDSVILFLQPEQLPDPCHTIIEWFGLEGTFKGHLVQPPLQRAGTSSTRSGCSERRPTWT